MTIAVAKETKFKENRVALTPPVVKDLVGKGFSVKVESGAGLLSFFKDADYEAAGATIATDAKSLYAAADVLLKVNPPLPAEVAGLRKGAILISFMWAGTNPELVDACANANDGRWHPETIEGGDHGCRCGGPTGYCDS
jgi:NAD(P) transhydrogenase subunit alpha